MVQKTGKVVSHSLSFCLTHGNELVLPFLLPCSDGLGQHFILNAEHLINNKHYLVRDVFDRDLILAILANPDVADVDYCEEDL